jgi:DNA-binding SARP family transcriptional activator
VEFRILRSLDVVGPDGAVALGGTKRRGLLALLLVQRCHMISSERIVAELWADAAERAVATVQT